MIGMHKPYKVTSRAVGYHEYYSSGCITVGCEAFETIDIMPKLFATLS